MSPAFAFIWLRKEDVTTEIEQKQIDAICLCTKFEDLQNKTNDGKLSFVSTFFFFKARIQLIPRSTSRIGMAQDQKENQKAIRMNQRIEKKPDNKIKL